MNNFIKFKLEGAGMYEERMAGDMSCPLLTGIPFEYVEK